MDQVQEGGRLVEEALVISYILPEPSPPPKTATSDLAGTDPSNHIGQAGA